MEQVLCYRFTEEQTKQFDLKFEGIEDPVVIDSSFLEDEKKVLELHKEVKELENKRREIIKNNTELANMLIHMDQLFKYFNRPKTMTMLVE